MKELLKRLCAIDGASGNEKSVRDFIISEIKDFCEYSVDNIGNIIAFKKGKTESKRRIMIDAHTDEVGLIITSITPDGFLRFKTLGGIDTAVLMMRRVLINGKINGVIGGKPHHLDKSASKLPQIDSLYIDIGATSCEEAEAKVSLGDTAVMCSDFTVNGEKIISKALDDRIGCAILIKLLKEESEYDFYGSFSTQEELGLRGARVAAYTINPESAIILEGTTAADIDGVAEEKSVCNLGAGAAISFMDGATSYDRDYYNAALKSGLPVQVKRAVTGGNNSGSVHLSREGVKTIAISVPCRYIHSANSVADERDINAAYSLAKYMLQNIASGNL